MAPVRVHVVDPPAYTPPYDHALCGALARAGADVTLVTSAFAYGDVPQGSGYRVDHAFYARGPQTPGGRARQVARLAQHVPDMLRYAVQLGTGAGLTPATAAQRQGFTPLTTSGVRLQYGLGITQLGDWVGHDGSIFGYSNMVFYLPREQAAVVVASNAADEITVPSQALWGEIVKALYPDTLPSWG